MCYTFEVEQSTVDVVADTSEAIEIAEFPSDLEVVGIVDGGFRSKSTLQLEILLDLRRLVIESEARNDTRGKNAGAKSAWSTTCHTTVEDDRNVIRSTDALHRNG